MADTGDAGGAAGTEIKPYRIHVPPKYLDLTKQKLELTRLPHEGSEPKSQDWWEPKPQVEPLIDTWLERYSWRDQEKSLNDSLPQFRTAITVPNSDTPLRLHFIHVRSQHANALPVLLLPPFPFTNLSFGHLVKPFTEPEDGDASTPSQTFDLVIPSLPGLGFSDPLPNNTPVIPAVAEMLNTLMGRLAYDHYLVTNAGAAASSPAEIDWKLANHLATHYAHACVGAHLIAPPLAAPKLVEAPLEWAKWSLASFFHVGILGYSSDDFAALRRATAAALRALSGADASKSSSRKWQHQLLPTPAAFGLNRFGLREPNTLAYALCDSPTGLLVFVIKALSLLGPSVTFTPEQILTFAQLAWLPGPEYALRFWAACAAHDEEEYRRKDSKVAAGAKPRVAITVFLGGSEASSGKTPAPEAGATGTAAAAQETQDPPAGASGAGNSNGDAERQIDVPSRLPHEETERYTCPAWGRTHYDVVFAQREPGRPGLLAWERPEVIVAGVRGLAREVLRVDRRLRYAAGEPGTEPLRGVVVSGDPGSDPGPPEPPAQQQQQQQQQLQPPPNASQEQVPREVILSKIPEEPPLAMHEPDGSTPQLQLPEEELTTGAVLGKMKEGNEEEAEEKKVPSPAPAAGEGKESADKESAAKGEAPDPDLLAPPVPAYLGEKRGDSFSSEGSPDTLVVSTPPLDLK